MSEYDVLLGDEASEFLDVADEKTERICKENLGYLADTPYPGRGRGDKEKLPIDGHRDRYRMHISRIYTTIYPSDSAHQNFQ
ncbi:type II toxin-antitoxin system RelE/ParE family toxin [Halobaculum rarum]|uniref:type II toxin-antitoxin system RelE/ParE family toxin n=1 Tax=Halobaculum rarum TaxID=3075122 RepID=UPI0032AEBF9A